ncbi:MAG: DUF402 domain-containing protein [Gaiellaceae bacterium]
MGDIVLFRSVYRGNVRWCYPCRYVGDWKGRHGLYCQPGSEGRGMKRSGSGDGRYLEAWASDVEPFRQTWEKGHVLRFMHRGGRHTIEVCWDRDWQFVCWYVNLQAPLILRGDRFDTTDWALDVWVEPDGSWRWKDEDDFAEAQALGILDEAAAAEVRAEGERVVAAKPWPTGWEDWRPPPEWRPLPLPEDWRVV